jgi:23S rRNA A2030 N6-methylase RlmJ
MEDFYGGGGYELRANESNRWKYLEAGISRIMNELEEGIDMHTVSFLL